MTNINDPEPDPIVNNESHVWDVVVEDMKERNKRGKDTYGSFLQPFNGRNSVIDIYQELLDMVVYLRTLICEMDENTPSISKTEKQIDCVVECMAILAFTTSENTVKNTTNLLNAKQDLRKSIQILRAKSLVRSK